VQANIKRVKYIIVYRVESVAIYNIVLLKCPRLLEFTPRKNVCRKLWKTL